MTRRGNSSRRKKTSISEEGKELTDLLGFEPRLHWWKEKKTEVVILIRGGLKESARVHNNKHEHSVITQPTLVTRLSASVNTHPLLCISFANTEF